MKILFALAGLHRVNRGAEVAFISIANELAKAGDAVTLIGCGPSVPETLYSYIQAKCISRENFRSFPSIPLLRSEYIYEELTFMPELLLRYRPSDYDVTLTCGYPFTNWLLRRPTLAQAATAACVCDRKRRLARDIRRSENIDFLDAKA